jgi:hypothetical protein
MSETDLPCVFGSEIMSNCPVQAILMQPSLQKYKKVSDPAMQQAKEFGEAMMPNVTFLPLPQFCGICPYLRKYNIQATKNE